MMDPNKRITSEHSMQDAYFQEEPLPTQEYAFSVLYIYVHAYAVCTHAYICIYMRMHIYLCFILVSIFLANNFAKFIFI